VLNRFNTVLITVLTVTHYSKNLKIKGIDTKNGKERKNSKGLIKINVCYMIRSNISTSHNLEKYHHYTVIKKCKK
jgi:hypothetical protein